MIDYFDYYTSKYDMNDERIRLKYNHSYRVMALQEKYAKLLGFSDEDVKIAKAIGLLHDIGRFEQLRVYNSFSDIDTVDHADYSVVQLFDKNEIEKFDIPKEWYEIIKFSIKNHNKFKIEDCTDDRVLMHAKLIRDTDKIDILYLLGELKELNTKAIDEPVTDKIIESIMNERSSLRSDEKNSNDRIATKFTFAFDINNDICLKEIKKNITSFYKQIDGEKYFKKIYEKIINYCDERIELYERNGN